MNIEHQTLRLSRLAMHTAAAGVGTPVQLLQRARCRCAPWPAHPQGWR